MKMESLWVLCLVQLMSDGLIVQAQSTANAYSQAVLADSPVVYYQFDEGSGATEAVDTSGNGNTGIYDNILLGSAGATAGMGYAAEFNGSNSFVAVPPLAGAVSLGGGGNDQFTIECWINPQSIAGAAIYTYDGWDTGALHFLWNWTGPGIQFSLNGNTTPGTTVFDSNPPISTGQWTYVAAVYHSDNTTSDVIVYINGQSIGTNVFTTAVPVDFEPAEIGAWSNGGRNFSGWMDEFAIYTNALSAAQVQDHYNAAWNSQSLPTILISKSSNGIAISWDGTNLVLQKNTNLLNSAGWEDVSGATNSPANMPIENNSMFYRLRYK